MSLAESLARELKEHEGYDGAHAKSKDDHEDVTPVEAARLAGAAGTGGAHRNWSRPDPQLNSGLRLGFELSLEGRHGLLEYC